MLTAGVMEISVGECAGVPLVRLAGDMRLWGKQGIDDMIRDTVHSLVAAEKKQIILNVSGVTNLDSRGVGCLARCYATAIKSAADVRLVTAPGLVLRILTEMGFRRMWMIFPDEASAAASFATPPTTA